MQSPKETALQIAAKNAHPAQHADVIEAAAVYERFLSEEAPVLPDTSGDLRPGELEDIVLNAGAKVLAHLRGMKWDTIADADRATVVWQTKQILLAAKNAPRPK